AGVPALSLWAGVPHYVASPPNPRGTEAMLSWLSEQLGMAVPIDMLRAQSRTWTEKVDAAAGEDEDLSDYIRSLEERVDEDAQDIVLDPETERGCASDGATLLLVDGAAIAAEFDTFLRDDRGERGDQDGC